MEMIQLILSGLALLAAVMCLILMVQEKKRNEKRNAAWNDLLRMEFDRIVKSIEDCGKIVELYSNAGTEKIQKIMLAEFENADERMCESIDRIANSMAKTSDFDEWVKKVSADSVSITLAEILKGTEEIKNHVAALEDQTIEKTGNDFFNQGLAAIFGYDPMKALKQERDRG